MILLRTFFVVAATLMSSTSLADTSVQVLMREKLESVHAILDALVMEDFPKVEVNAKKLWNISRATTWYKADSPDFQALALNFQKSTDFLGEQARAKNIEGVAVGYIRLTLDCMQCHNRVRAQQKK